MSKVNKKLKKLKKKYRRLYREYNDNRVTVLEYDTLMLPTQPLIEGEMLELPGLTAKRIQWSGKAYSLDTSDVSHFPYQSFRMIQKDRP